MSGFSVGSSGGGGPETDTAALAALTTHIADETAVHGIADTSDVVIDETVFYLEDYGAVGDGVTNDSVAVRNCVAAAKAVGGTIRPRGVVYVLDSAPLTAHDGNSIIPIDDALDSQKSVRIIGARPTSEITNTAYNNISFASQGYTVFKTTRTDAYSGTHGPVSVFGGRTPEHLGASFRNYFGSVTMENFIVQLPFNSTVCGIDAVSWGGFERKDVMVVYGTTGGEQAAVATNINFGIRHNARWVGSRNHGLRSWAFQAYAGHVFFDTDHARMDADGSFRCRMAMGFDVATGTSDGGLYPLVDSYFMAEGCPTTFAGFNITTGIIDIPYETFFMGFKTQTEAGAGAFALTELAKDTNNKLRGLLFLHHFNGLAVADALPATTGMANLDIRMPRQGALSTRKIAAPADAEVGTSQMMLWLDDTATAPRARFKVKDSAGTVKNATLLDSQRAYMDVDKDIRTYASSALVSSYQNFKDPADTQPTIVILGNGSIAIGAGGSTAADILINRAAANRLEMATGDTISWAAGLGGTHYSNSFPASVPGSAVVVQNQGYISRIVVLHRCTLTGIRVSNGATSNGNLKVALFDNAAATINQLAISAATAQGTINTTQEVPFTGTYDAHPGIYHIWMASDSATATYVQCRLLVNSSVTATEYASPPATKTRPSTAGASGFPLMSTY